MVPVAGYAARPKVLETYLRLEMGLFRHLPE